MRTLHANSLQSMTIIDTVQVLCTYFILVFICCEKVYVHRGGRQLWSNVYRMINVYVYAERALHNHG